MNTHVRDNLAFISGYRKVTSRTVASTVASTDLLNGEITLAAGMLGVNSMLRLTAWGDWRNASGGDAATPRLQVVVGGTTIFDTGAFTSLIQTQANRYGWWATFEMQNLGAANAQVARFSWWAQEANRSAGAGPVLFTTGSGVSSQTNSGAQSCVVGNATSVGLAIDTTTSKLVELKVINGSSSASYDTRLFGAIMELV